MSLVAFLLNGKRDGWELNSTSSLFVVRVIHSGHFHGKPFGCVGGITDVNDGCCIMEIGGLVVTTVVNGACFGGLCNTDGLLGAKEKS